MKFIPYLLIATAALSLSACGDKTPEVSAPVEAERATSADQPIRLTPEFQREAGVVVAAVGPQRIASTLRVHGEIVQAADRVHRVTARYPGVATQVTKRIGERVSKGETLVVVESNDSLVPYRIVAPGAGQVLERHINVGEALSEQTLFVIGDLNEVWAQLAIFPGDAARVRAGMSVDVQLDRGGEAQRVTLDYIAPSADAQRRIMARATLDNRAGQWPPGAFVSADLITESRSVDIAVPLSAVQYHEDQTVVFVETAEGFAPRAVRLGLQDREHAEVTEGLRAGERVVVANSFLLKSEWLKAEGGDDD